MYKLTKLKKLNIFVVQLRHSKISGRFTSFKSTFGRNGIRFCAAGIYCADLSNYLLSLNHCRAPASSIAQRTRFQFFGLRVDGVSRLVDTTGLLCEGIGTSDYCNCTVATAIPLDVLSLIAIETCIASRNRVEADSKTTAKAVVVIPTLCIGDL